MTPEDAYEALRLERLHTAPEPPPPAHPRTPQEVDQAQRVILRQMIHAIATEMRPA